jgi:hypothetical protein
MNIVYCSKEQTALLADNESSTSLPHEWASIPATIHISDTPLLQWIRHCQPPLTPTPAAGALPRRCRPPAGSTAHTRSSWAYQKFQSNDFPFAGLIFRAIHSVGWVHSLAVWVGRFQRRGALLLTSLVTILQSSDWAKYSQTRTDIEKSQLAWRTNRTPRCK